MGRTSGCVLALLGAAALLATGCSVRQSQPSDLGAATTTLAPAPEGPTTTISDPGESTTVAPATTVPPTSAPVVGPGTTGGTDSAGPIVATSHGWRLALTQPATGATIGSVAVLCYEVTGTSREPVVALEITLLQAGSMRAAGAFRIDGTVGRGTARVGLAGVPPGRYDLRAQLFLNGEQLNGAEVSVPSVTVVESVAQTSCS